MYFIKRGGLCIVFADGNKCIVSGGKDAFLYELVRCVFFVVCVLCNPGSGMVCSLYF